MFYEDCELQDLVKQTLEKSGTLSKIRADLRANVFEALQENGTLLDLQPKNDELQNFAKNADGILLLNLVKEFLDYFKLSYTMSVFEPELASYNIRCDFKDHSKLCDQLNLSSDAIPHKKGPILYHMMQIIRNVGNDTHSKKGYSFDTVEDRSRVENCKASTNTSTEYFQMQPSSIMITSKESDKLGKKDEARNPFSKVNTRISSSVARKNSTSVTAVHGTDFSQQSLTSLMDLPPLSPQSTAGTGKNIVGASSKSSKEIDKLKELLIDTSLSDPKGDNSFSSAITDDEKQFENMNDWSECDSTDTKFS